MLHKHYNMDINDVHNYVLVLLKKGPKYDILEDDIREQNFSAHNSYYAELQANGVLTFSGNTPGEGDLYGVAIYNIADDEKVKTLVSNDPGVTAGLFDYEIHLCFGIEGTDKEEY